MKKIVNIYNGFIGTLDQGGGINYVQNLLKKQSKYFDEIYLISLGKKKKLQKKFGKSKVIQYSISTNHNWLFFCIKLFIFLFKNENKFKGSYFHIHRLYFAPFIKIIKKSKIIATVHTKTFDVFANKYPYLRFLIIFFKIVEFFIIKIFIYKLSFAGKSALKLYVNRYNLDTKKLFYLPPIFDYKKIDKSSFFKTEKKNIILVVGRISLVKRPLLAIKLFKSAIDKDKYIREKFKILFVGDGDQVKSLKNYILINNLKKHVLPIKKIKSNMMPEIYSRCHSVLFLSKNEVNPFVIKEALTSGKPIFTTNVGTAKHLVNKNNGIVISTKNPIKNLNKYINFLKTKYNNKKIIKSSFKFIKKDQFLLNKNLLKIYK